MQSEQHSNVHSEARQGVIDLLGALAFGELAAFDRMAGDARMAPDVQSRAALCELAAVEMTHYRGLVTRITDLGGDPAVAMQPFVVAVETFHSRTEPSTWGEALIKAYVGDGLAADFYREVAAFVDPVSRAVVEEATANAAATAFIDREVATILHTDRTAKSRLSLWGRRLVGEAISQTQQVVAERDALAVLLIDGVGDLSGIGRLIDRVTRRHMQRMTRMGLSN